MLFHTGTQTETTNGLLWDIKFGTKTSQKISEDVSVDQIKKKNLAEIHMKDHINCKTSSRGVAKTGMIYFFFIYKIGFFLSKI